MSWDPCPECGRATERAGESCNRCCDRHQDTTEIVDTICRHGEQARREPAPDGDRFDYYRGQPFRLTRCDYYDDAIREKLKK